MTEENTKLDVKGRRHCRACIRERKSRYHKGSLGVGRHNKTAGNNHERDMAEALEANPPQIVWRRDKDGVMRHVSIDDPHAERESPPRKPKGPQGYRHRILRGNLVSDAPNIYTAFSAAMEEVQAVRKEGFNDSQRYNFRGIDQVVNAVGPIFRKHHIIPVPYHCAAEYRDVLTSTGKPTREVTVSATYRFYGPAGDFIEAVVPGESLDSGDKGTAKAMSVAYRIVLLQSLCIPTDDKDPDQDSYERAALVETPPLPDAVVEARIAVKNAWEVNGGAFYQPAVEKHFTEWSNGEVLMDATADRLYQYADHLKSEAGA